MAVKLNGINYWWRCSSLYCKTSSWLDAHSIEEMIIKEKNVGKKKDNCNKKYFKASARMKNVHCHVLESLRQKDLFWDINYFHYIDYFSVRSIYIDIHPVCFIMRLLVRQEYLPVKNNISRDAS